MNNVVLIGRLTRDPEVRYISDSQMAVARFSLAINRGKDKNGNDKGADFPNIVVFGKRAENCERFLVKGSPVGIHGRIQTGKYTNKNGDTVYTTEVVANNVEFLGYSKDGENGKEKADRQEEIPEGFQALDDEECPF
uniref:single-stranded DNA-binding protein n=1 Tax=[Ruminococcus] torques TaxID=33039 RepID=UPI00402A6CC9